MIEHHAYEKRLADALASPPFVKLVTRLDQLLEAVTPADWEKVAYFDEQPSVYRTGARHGVSFQDELPPADAIRYLLDLTDKTAPEERMMHDMAVIDYFIEHQSELAAVLPRVQAAWFRYVEMAKQDQELRELFLDDAREKVAALKIDRTRAAAMLR